MKKYKLLKDLPGLKAGTIIKYDKSNNIISILNLGEGGGVGSTQEINMVLDGDSEDSFLNRILYYMLLELLQNENNDERLERVQDNKSIYELEEGDEYYFIYNDGEIWDTGIVSGTQAVYKAHLEFGNIFLTEEEAKKELNKRKALAKIKRWIWKNNIKIEGLGDIGYKIYLNGNQGLFVDEYANNKCGIGDIIFQDRENAIMCLQECKEEREILFDLN